MKSILHFILKNRILLSVFAMLIAIAGYQSYQKLPVDAFPDVSPNLVQIFTTTEGLAPEEIEKFVTFPIEASMNGLPHIQKMRSVSNFGLSVVNIYLEDDVDIYFARQLVGERLGEAAEQIPEGFGTPAMGPISTGMGLVLFYYLEDETGKYSLKELRSIQDWFVKFQLQTVTGVTEVLGIGGHEKQFNLEIKPEALIRYDISVQDLVEIVKANNLNVGAQFIEKNSEEFIVRSLGLATKIEDLQQIVIKSEEGISITLDQVVDIVEGGAIRRGLQTKDGVTEVVAGMVIKLFGSNSSTVISEVEDKLKQINESLPQGIKIKPYYQQKSLVEACVKTVRDALWQGIVLVILVLLFFMRSFRPATVVALSIPFSVLFTIIGMQLLGMSANLMSMGGIAIAIGMLVDGTIVVVENINRVLQSKQGNKIDLIKQSVLEVSKPIFFSVAIIILVFLPLFTLQGVEGKTFKPLAYSVALSMLGSLLFAFFFAPVFASFFMKGKSNTKEKSKGLLDKAYATSLRFFFAKRWLALTLSAALLILGISIFPLLGSEFTPKMQEGTIVVRLSMAPSISLTESKRLTMLVEKRLVAIPEVTNAITRIGRGEVGAHADPVNSAEMFVILKDPSEWRVSSQAELESLLRKDLGNIPGVLVNFTQPIAMAVDELLEGVRAELAIKLFGDDLDSLKRVADKVQQVVSQVQGAADVQADLVSGMPQLQIKINRSALARYGLNITDVQSVIRTAVGGEQVGQIFEGIKRFNIVLRYQEKARNQKEAIGNILIQGKKGIKIPLSQLANLEEVVGPRQITRENSQRFISIQCNVNDRDIGSFVEDAKAQIKEKIQLPAGYFLTWGGQFRLQEEANKRLAVVIPITLLLVFLLLFTHFNSMRDTILIFLNIPLALVGGVVSLWISGQNLSVPSSVGFIALFGIALGNGMVMLSFMNQLLQQGHSATDAAYQGALVRLKPVLMTACTSALGLIPLLISTGTGSEVQRPLATVVIGGIVTSTFLTLFVLPIFYAWFVTKTKI